MTRLRRLRTPHGASPDVRWAFRVLRGGPSLREIGLVADLLREAGADIEYNDELVELAVECGSGALVALDLSTAVAYGVEALTAGPGTGADHSPD